VRRPRTGEAGIEASPDIAIDLKEHAMTSEATDSKLDHHRQIRITIDGQAFTVDDRHYTAAELLALAGLPAAGYDLTRVGKHGHVETFRDEQRVSVKDGDVFVSVNQQGTVA
jgi:hypothetical protein